MYKAMALFIFASTGLMLFFLNCSGSLKSAVVSSSSIDTTPATGRTEQELIRDPSFRTNFRARRACGASDRSCGADYVIANPFASSAETSPWLMGQTGSLSNLLPDPTAEGDHYLFTDDSPPPLERKSLRIYDGGQIEMSVNGSNEQPDGYVEWSADRKWPHFLFEQVIAAPGGGAEDSKPLIEMKALWFKLDAQVLYNDNKRLVGYVAADRAAQFWIYFTVQNLTGSHQTNPHYGDDFLWLGVPVFDDRYPMMAGGTITDVGPNSTGRPIVTIPYSAFSNVSTHSGSIVTLRTDLLPFAIAAVQQSCGPGKPLASCDLNDYKVGTMNLGYEVTGANSVAIRLSGLSLKAAY